MRKEKNTTMKQRTRRCLSVLLALALMLSLLPGTAWAAEDRQEISSAEEFAAMDVGGNYILTEDITITAPYGSSSQKFAGTFDGNGHTITLHIDGTNYLGAFAYIAPGGKIENLKTDGSVTAASSSSYSGGIAGVCEGTIIHCGNAAMITGKKRIGGIAGHLGSSDNAGHITNCYNIGEIQSTASSACAAGGIAGYVQNDSSAVSNCCNSGTVTAKSQFGTIAGYCSGVISDSCWLDGCTSTNISTGYPAAESAQNSGSYTDANKACEKLNQTAGGNAGWKVNDNGAPVLDLIPSGGADATPKLTITTPTATIYKEPGAGTNEVTLTVKMENMPEDTAVTWSADNPDAAVLEPVSDTTASIRVLPVNGGTAVITASVTIDGMVYTAQSTVTVIPHITTVHIEGTLAAGQTVEAVVSIEGGEEYDFDNYPPITFQWRKATEEQYRKGVYEDIAGEAGRTFTIPKDLEGQYLSVSFWYGIQQITPNLTYGPIAGQADGVLAADLAALTLPEEIRPDGAQLDLPAEGAHGSAIAWTSSRPDVIAADGTVILPEEGTVTVTLTATLTYAGKTAKKDFSIEVWSRAAAEADKQYALRQAADSLGEWYKLYPVYGEDTNVNEMVEADLRANGYDGITVSIQSAAEDYGGAGIADDGGITYFYADPNSAPAVHFGRFQVTFLLEKDGARLICGPVPVILYWDADKVEETMKQEIMDKVTDETILAEGDTVDSVTENLTLPKTVDGKTWAQIFWESSDKNVISVSGENQDSADTLFDPYVGVVKPGENAQTVTLTAKCIFQLTSDVTGSEAPIVLYKTFEVTVPAMTEGDAEAIRAELFAKLDAGFAAKGLTDAVTGEQLQRNADGSYTAINDIQLPTTRDFGVDGKYYPVILSSSDPDVLSVPDGNNAARVTVCRPAVGEANAKATLTVTLYDRDTSVAASKTFEITVPALTQEEIDDERALMAKVKAHYFDGLNNGANAAKDDVRYDLTPFVEVYEDENGQLVWVRDTKDMTGSGIVPTPIEGWEELEAWRLFKSSNPAVIAHETLEVTRQSEAKAVTITSYLSSETLGRYGELYRSDPVKYAQYAALQDLYYQPVTAETASQSAVSARTAAAAKTGSAVSENDTATVLVRGTKNPASTIPVAETIDVTFTLVGPEGTWIVPVTLTGLDEQKTVYDVFQQVLSENGYTYTRERGTYIVSITKPNGDILAEEDMGENSGWLYRVNGTIPDVYMAACGLHDGDTIQVFYTEDYEKENGYENDDWSSSTQPGREEENGAEVVWNSGRGVYEITLLKNSRGPQRVALSAEPGQIVVIVYADGTEKVLKKSALADGKIRFLLEEDASVRLVTYTNSFADVAQDAWYADAVDFAAGRELLRGVAADRFAPNTTLSRGMLATVLCRLEGAEGETRQSDFSDVGADAWYAQAVAWAAAEEIVVGYADGSFRPDAPITREQLAVMLYRYAETQGMRTGGRDTLRSFSDSGSVSDWARDAVAWAVDSGILAGRPDGTLDPAGTATRAEAAAMLQRLVGLMVR